VHFNVKTCSVQEQVKELWEAIFSVHFKSFGLTKYKCEIYNNRNGKIPRFHFCNFFAESSSNLSIRKMHTTKLSQKLKMKGSKGNLTKIPPMHKILYTFLYCIAYCL